MLCGTGCSIDKVLFSLIQFLCSDFLTIKPSGLVPPIKQLFLMRYIRQIILNFQKMNRCIFTILEKGTSINAKQLQKLQEPTPYQTAYISQQFPVYPITINMYLQNPPFNKISVCFEQKYTPSRGTLFGSEDGVKYFKIHELGDLKGRDQYIKIFESKIQYNYIRLVFEQPFKDKVNICKQIKLKGIQFSLITFFKTQFVCSLAMKLKYHPVLFRLLEILEYKSLLLHQKKDKKYEVYSGKLAELVKMINQKKFDKLLPEQNHIDKWSQQITAISNEPLYKDDFIQYPDPIKIKKDIFKLQKQIRGSQINRFGDIHPQILKYFQKYYNVVIKDGYLRYLSSAMTEDHNTALVDFWSDIQQMQEITPAIEEAVVMYYNYFLQNSQPFLKINAIKTLILFRKRQKKAMTAQVHSAYLRVLQNIFQCVHQTEDEELRAISLRYCYMLFDLVENHPFVDFLLHAYLSYPLSEQILKLEILEKLTFRQVDIQKKDPVTHFLINLLLNNELGLNQKNRAYNVAAYLASLFGKPNVMKDFQKLNSMILMTMQKNIDGKLAKIQKGGQSLPKKDEEPSSCEYCGEVNKNFNDQNLFDLHLAKECKFLTECNYCHQTIQIPQLFKHQVEQCDRKHEFKHCDNCFEVIKIKDEDKHNKQCANKLQTKCPLCYTKVDNKLKLKEHVLIDGCPNNPR